jgi:hypothetical protein
MTNSSAAWLLLISNLPGRNPKLRMRLWRGLKAAGAALLRDGAYLLPNSERSRRVFEEQGANVRKAGGLAHVLALDAESSEQQSQFAALFDRTADYAESIAALQAFERELGKLTEPEARQRLASLVREVAGTMDRDFFPAEAFKQIEAAMASTEAAVNAQFSPDEPRAAHRKIRLRNRRDYQRRSWATREHLWVDRVASAWLIRRFIDPHAKFLWLKHVKDCPKRALGFDFDGAEFTHVGSKVTFEVLVGSFGLDKDVGLIRLGALVHHLDVGGIPTAEGPGFAAIMAGARTLQPDDDALLKAMTPVLDSLYAGYANASEKGA